MDILRYLREKTSAEEDSWSLVNLPVREHHANCPQQKPPLANDDPQRNANPVVVVESNGEVPPSRKTSWHFVVM